MYTSIYIHIYLNYLVSVGREEGLQLDPHVPPHLDVGLVTRVSQQDGPISTLLAPAPQSTVYVYS